MSYQNHSMSYSPIIFWTIEPKYGCTRPVRAGDLVALRYPLGVQGTKSGTVCLVLGRSNDTFNFELGLITCLVNEEIVDISPSALEWLDNEIW